VMTCLPDCYLRSLAVFRKGKRRKREEKEEKGGKRGLLLGATLSGYQSVGHLHDARVHMKLQGGKKGGKEKKKKGERKKRGEKGKKRRRRNIPSAMLLFQRRSMVLPIYSACASVSSIQSEKKERKKKKGKREGKKKKKRGGRGKGRGDADGRPGVSTKFVSSPPHWPCPSYYSWPVAQETEKLVNFWGERKKKGGGGKGKGEGRGTGEKGGGKQERGREEWTYGATSVQVTGARKDLYSFVSRRLLAHYLSADRKRRKEGGKGGEGGKKRKKGRSRRRLRLHEMFAIFANRFEPHVHAGRMTGSPRHAGRGGRGERGEKGGREGKKRGKGVDQRAIAMQSCGNMRQGRPLLNR